ncbi:MAG: hypothetical protein WB713_00170 [Methyloceanibacter sp.]
MMTLYRSKIETVDAFRYQSGLETMDFKYPYPDWLEGYVVARGEFGLELSTKIGKVTVRPGQWIVKAGNRKIHILNQDAFHAEYEAVTGA